MPRLLVSLTLAIAVAASASAQGIVLGAENAAGPWGQADGTGCGNDVVAAAFRAAGVDLRLSVMPYARAKDMTERGALAGCFGMAWEGGFEGKVVFSRLPLYTVSAVFFQNKRAPIAARKAADIGPDVVLGTVRDYEYPGSVSGLRAKGVRFDEGDSEVAALRKLALGRIQAVVAMVDELKSADYLLRQAGVGDSVEVAFSGAVQGTYVGFSLANAQGGAAKAAFDRGMDIILADGTYGRILAEWNKKL